MEHSGDEKDPVEVLDPESPVQTCEWHKDRIGTELEMRARTGLQKRGGGMGQPTRIELAMAPDRQLKIQLQK